MALLKYSETEKDSIVARMLLTLKKDYTNHKNYKYCHGDRPDNCQICGDTKRISYDHDHQTGQFRGWLCNKCNLTLGLVRDDITTLGKMIEYLSNK